MARRSRYVPALGFDLLTPLYDPLVRVTVREGTFKGRLVDDARIERSHRVLDVGCGTGTLLLLVIRESTPDLAIGLDGDGKVLRIAKAKAAKQAARAGLVRALSVGIPFADGSFDRVLSTLMLHHLTRDEKLRTLREILRVLRPGGELHVADWGRPHHPLLWLPSFLVALLDGFGRAADNVKGRLPDLFRAAGFEEVREGPRFATLFGTVALYTARRPATMTEAGRER